MLQCKIESVKEINLKVDKKDVGMRLDLFILKSALERNLSLTRTHIKRMILEGDVTLNNAFQKPGYKIKAGEVFKIRLKKLSLSQGLQPQEIPLEIIYQDKDLAVINKPAGLVVHPAAGNKQNTLVNALLYHFKDLSLINPQRPGIVHRLDKDASGIMLVAKSDKAHLALAKQFAKHDIKRQYVALVKGSMEFDEDVIELSIARNPKDRKKMSVGFGKNAKYAKTHYKTLMRKKDSSLLELSPFTGRTHQLRVHLAFIGHPILGDIKYGRNNAFSRLALHAIKIGFLHPSTHKFMEFSISIPEAFLNYFKK